MDCNTKIVDYFRKFRQVLIVGILPPPLGGVSVHVYRMHKALKNSTVFNTHENSAFPLQKYFHLIWRVISGNFDAIHLHETNEKALLILFLLRLVLSFKIVLTIHNSRLFETKSKLKTFFWKRMIRHLSLLVVVGDHIIKDFKKRHVVLPNETLVEPAFFPPPQEEEEEIFKTYPESLLDFLKKKRPILVANAFQISFFRGEDLYGLDMCIDLTAIISKEYPTVGFVFALANENANTGYFQKMKHKIKELGVEQNFYFLTGQRELWPLFKTANLMIRPTTTDGDALSIREAMYLGCPALASDVSERPAGTILFKSRDLENLYIKTKEALHKTKI